MTTTSTRKRETIPPPHNGLMEITPAMARAWLGHNTQNRSVKTARVSQYARDMKRGKWLFTGEAIKFAEDGTLLDGQNRLHACIDADTPFMSMVVIGLLAEAQAVMDTGANRTGGDALRLRGIENADHTASVVAFHAWWRYGVIKHAMTKPGGADRLTHTEILEHLEEFPNLKDAASMAASVQRTLPLPLGAMGAFIYEITDLDVDASQDFLGRVTNFQTEGAGDPIATLLRRAILGRERRERVYSATGLYLLCRSWNAWRKGETIHRYPLGSEERGWAPIPELI